MCAPREELIFEPEGFRLVDGEPGLGVGCQAALDDVLVRVGMTCNRARATLPPALIASKASLRDYLRYEVVIIKDTFPRLGNWDLGIISEEMLWI